MHIMKGAALHIFIWFILNAQKEIDAMQKVGPDQNVTRHCSSRRQKPRTTQTGITWRRDVLVSGGEDVRVRLCREATERSDSVTGLTILLTM